MSKRRLTLLIIFLLFLVLILLRITDSSSLLKTQVPLENQGSLVVCSHVICAQTTDDGTQTNCRRTVVRCTSPSCNAGPCQSTEPPPAAKPASNLVPVSSLIPISANTPNPKPSLRPVDSLGSPQAAVAIETEDNELKLWQELGVIAVSLLRHLGRAVITLVNQI